MERVEFDLGRTGVPLSAVVVAEGRFAYVSGQGPLRDGAYVPGSIEEETERTLGNLAEALAAVGASKQNVVRCGVFLADIADIEGMNRAYTAFFGDLRPARTTIQAAALPGGIRVEIDCVAVLP
jgi:2-iminobutanoate/2-iminopropanoate deaminase